ncbi:ANK-REP-REGION domain-containing protein [Mycena indigotica]|uniref:ANK-REP-REGION domain-containing protein n=1 Tax=Mycena indigotica TaxID=2126181 RepID=A0A8H6T6T4_9AGAR|nr:ANK-REP-REGION domain-containing protein [Mycena indigotica]KAF7311991.1 ANK-REP-REGION domain-containing protein [Mycena indigotica]
MPPRLPHELCDLIVDFLHADTAALGRCALVCRGWIATSRYHLFAHIDMSPSTGRRSISRAVTLLNDLLASSHSTLPLSIRNLEFYNNPDSDSDHFSLSPLCVVLPKIVQLRHLKELSLSELPFQVLSALPRLETLRLYGITAGRGLLRLGKCAPSLRFLAFDSVYAVPHVNFTMETCIRPTIALSTIHIRRSSIVFLPWLLLVSPTRLRVLDIDEFAPAEIPALIGYLSRPPGPPEHLRLALQVECRITEDDVCLWERLADALGDDTRLDVIVIAGEDAPLDDKSQHHFLWSSFPLLARLNLLTLVSRQPPSTQVDAQV